MAPKKSTGKGKGKETKAAEQSREGWGASKCSESTIYTLVDECLLLSQEIVQWRSAESHDRPYEGTKEIVMFCHFVERGLVVPTSKFFCGLFFSIG